MTAPAAQLRRRASVQRLAWSIEEASELYGLNPWAIRRRCERGRCAYVRLGAHRIGILEGDVQALTPWPAPMPTALDNGLVTIRTAFAGRDLLRPDEIAEALGVSRDTIGRLIDRGELRGQWADYGLRVERRWFVRWLIRCRVPPLWEC